METHPEQKIDKQYWEKRLVQIVENHFRAAEERLPLFRAEELRRANRIFLRNIKYTGLDFILLILNIFNLIAKLFFKKQLFEKQQTFTEKYMRRRFDELVFHSKELEEELVEYFEALDENINSLIEDEIRILKAQKIPRSKYEKIIADAVEKSMLLPDITKLVIVETVIPIFTSYYFANKMTKGFGPVGVAVAQSYYWNQLAWYQRTWYKLPEWFAGSPYPFWVPVIGSIVGFLVGLFIAAPILNALIDWLLNLVISPEKRLKKQLMKSKKQLLYADKSKKERGMIKIVFEKMNLAGEVLDYLKDLYFVVR
ncbi:hypothetical protein JXJ21_21735 [candidate division KSB1 bacterium]|nr:hypothetical protein [candidate division KSB1 bacterium]